MRPKTVRLPYRLDAPDDLPLLSAMCMKLQAEMLDRSSGRERDLARFDGTIAGLSRKYPDRSGEPLPAAEAQHPGARISTR